MSKLQKEIGQGHGVPGRYAGLSDLYCNEQSSQVVLLPIPFDQTTTYKKGSDKGPEALIEASRNMELYDIETESEAYLKGIFTAPPIIAKTSEEMLELTYKRTKAYLHKGKFVIAVGGEHSVSYGPIRAYVEHFKKLTIVQFDAHADLQNAYEGNPWSHACIMARVKELSGVSKIVSVGVRSLSSEELPLLNKPTTFFGHDIYDNAAWMYQVLELLSGPVYITFDLDAFDSSLMPSTGTPEPGGLGWDQTMKLLKLISLKNLIVGFDVVELCPNPNNHAPDYLAAKLIYKLLSYKFASKQDVVP